MPVRPGPGIILLLVASALPLRSGTYANWVTAWFSPAERTAGLASPMADPDHDGCRNLVEYWAGTSPRATGDRARAELGMAPAPEVHYPHDPTAIDTSATLLVSGDLTDWRAHATPAQMTPTAGYRLNGHRFAKLRLTPAPGVVFDSDGDGLDDFFEEQLIASDPHDAFRTLADILPDADFDANGTPNLDEPANAPASPGNAKPPLLDADTLAAALSGLTPGNPSALEIHTPLE